MGAVPIPLRDRCKKLSKTNSEISESKHFTKFRHFKILNETVYFSLYNLFSSVRDFNCSVVLL